MKARQPQLPQEILPHSNRLIQIILTLLCPWLIFALANIGANLYLKNFPQNRGYWLIQQKWSMLMNTKEPIDWLILGDSSCNQGVIPQIMETELSATAMNLCTIGDSLVLNDAWMLSKYIKEHGAPKNILLVHVYDIWDREIKWNVTGQTPLNWGYWKKLEPNLSLNTWEKKEVFVNKYIPLYSQNTSLKKAIENNDGFFDKKYKLEPKGYMVVSEADPWRVERDSRGHLKEIAKSQQFSLSQTNRKSLDALIKLAEKHEINIYLANSPLYQKLYRDADFQAYYNKVQQEFEKISDRHKNFHRVMIEPMTFNKEEMENADHLISSSAEAYTKQLVKEIKSQSK